MFVTGPFCGDPVCGCFRCTANRQSLHVSYVHLSRASANMAIWLADEPHEMLELFNAAAQKEVIKLFPNYGCVGWLHTSHFRIS